MKTKYVALSSPIALGDVVAFSDVPESVDLINGVSMLGTHIGTQEDADGQQWFISGTYNFATNIFTVDHGDLNLVLIDKNLAQIFVDGGNWGLA
jgi:hypothetical protein